MQLTEILTSEHRVIEQVIAALDAAADRVDAGETVRAGFFLDAARFIGEFADGFHHGKEEGVLFEALARAGMPTDTGPIAVMLYEHDRGREITAGLRDAATRWAAGEAGLAVPAAGYARAYAELLTGHIFKEDHILFPMAAQAIAPPDEAALLAEFAAIERTRAAQGTKASYLELARALCDEMGVDADALPRRVAELPCHAAH
jgi:hemerythrin-like domain-containing protein